MNKQLCTIKNIISSSKRLIKPCDVPNTQISASRLPDAYRKDCNYFNLIRRRNLFAMHARTLQTNSPRFIVRYYHYYHYTSCERAPRIRCELRPRVLLLMTDRDLNRMCVKLGDNAKIGMWSGPLPFPFPFSFSQHWAMRKERDRAHSWKFLRLHRRVPSINFNGSQPIAGRGRNEKRKTGRGHYYRAAGMKETG